MLNEFLYLRLKALYGNVKVVSEGVPLQYNIVADPITGRESVLIVEYGEAYAVDCPFCVYRVGRPDRRRRLYINHHWGVPAPDLPQHRFWNLVKCFNENCVSVPEYAEYLRQQVYGGVRLNDVDISRVEAVEETPTCQLPPMRPLHELPCSHPAHIFLSQRGFNSYEVAYKYGLGFATAEAGPKVAGRIIIPVYVNSQLVGWQGRAVYPTEKKYHTAAGSRISHALYGYDNLPADFDSVILVEGVLDVWRIGVPALALFGTNLSRHQLQLLFDRNIKNVVIFLDADAAEKALKLADKLSSSFENVVVASTPFGDPADFTRDDCLRFIKGALDHAFSRGSC